MEEIEAVDAGMEGGNDDATERGDGRGVKELIC